MNPRSESLQLVVGGQPLATALGFFAQSVIVRNFSNQWVYIQNADAYVQPFEVGATFPIGGTQVAEASFAAPSGIPQPVAIPNGICNFIFTEEYLKPASGQVTQTRQDFLGQASNIQTVKIPLPGYLNALLILSNFGSGNVRSLPSNTLLQSVTGSGSFLIYGNLIPVNDNILQITNTVGNSSIAAYLIDSLNISQTILQSTSGLITFGSQIKPFDVTGINVAAGGVAATVTINLPAQKTQLIITSFFATIVTAATVAPVATDLDVTITDTLSTIWQDTLAIPATAAFRTTTTNPPGFALPNTSGRSAVISISAGLANTFQRVGIGAYAI